MPSSDEALFGGFSRLAGTQMNGRFALLFPLEQLPVSCLPLIRHGFSYITQPAEKKV